MVVIRRCHIRLITRAGTTSNAELSAGPPSLNQMNHSGEERDSGQRKKHYRYDKDTS